ncbi:LPS export ABC transporter permease LptG [Candidatus Pseudothioglobus singularis]|nr:LPS export ABC transporter permease LptG [Candidatus Pseudothioglobus singularis]
MKIKDRYIAKTLLSYTLVVIVVWLSIYSFFNFLSELNSVGKANYTILEAFQYIVLQMPEVAYDQASALILLGCILGMGHLATTGQLLIFRASGVSVFKITWLTIKNAMIFLFILILVGETLAPALTHYAENNRSNALGEFTLAESQDGFWIRDGDNFINVENNIDGSSFKGITIIEVNNENRIERVINSDSGFFDGKSINLNDVNIFSINIINKLENILFKERFEYAKGVAFDRDLIASFEKKPEDLSTFTIVKQIQFLTENKLRAGVFEVELFKRLGKPVSLLAMILIAMLFIFGSTRTVTLGRKIFLGVAIGLTFELISRISGALSLSYEFSPFLSSFIPSLLAIIIAVMILIKKSSHT